MSGSVERPPYPRLEGCTSCEQLACVRAGVVDEPWVAVRADAEPPLPAAAVDAIADQEDLRAGCAHSATEGPRVKIPRRALAGDRYFERADRRVVQVSTVSHERARERLQAIVGPHCVGACDGAL